jgi:hypothetical protein
MPRLSLSAALALGGLLLVAISGCASGNASGNASGPEVGPRTPDYIRIEVENYSPSDVVVYPIIGTVERRARIGRVQALQTSRYRLNLSEGQRLGFVVYDVGNQTSHITESVAVHNGASVTLRIPGRVHLSHVSVEL